LPYKEAFPKSFLHHSAELIIGASTVTCENLFSCLISLLQSKLVQDV